MLILFDLSPVHVSSNLNTQEVVQGDQITYARGATLLRVTEVAAVETGDVIEMVRPLPDDAVSSMNCYIWIRCVSFVFFL